MNANSYDSSLQQSLAQARVNSHNALRELAINGEFYSIIETAFGNDYDSSSLDWFYQQWINNNFDSVPEIEIRSSSELNGANGAFSEDTNKIYLSLEYVTTNDPDAISKLLLEEYAHYVDSQINEDDTAGDEGEIFATLASGDSLSPTELAQLQTEDDSAVINLDGEDINIEQKVIGDDGRDLVEESTDYPWSMIGFISSEWDDPDQSGITLGGTGALFLSPFHVLTAAHVIWNKAEYEASGDGYASSVTVNFGQDGQERFYGTAEVTNMITFNGYVQDSNWTLNNEGEWKPNSKDYDLALLTLDRNIGDFNGYFGYDLNSYEGLNVNLAGYPADLADSWSWQHGTSVPFEDASDVELYSDYGAIDSIVGETFYYELDTYGGQSGAPIWRYDSDLEERYIVGVHSGYIGSSNVAAQLTSDKLDSLQEHIDDSTAPTDLPDFVDYDDWFGTSYAYFRNDEISRSSTYNESLSISPGDDFTFRSVARNNGTATEDSDSLTPSIDVSFYASTNTFSSNDYHLGTVSLDSVAPFEWEEAILSSTFPSIPDGNYYLSWSIDSGNDLDEFIEDNNSGLLDDFILSVI